MSEGLESFKLVKPVQEELNQFTAPTKSWNVKCVNVNSKKNMN